MKPENWMPMSAAANAVGISYSTLRRDVAARARNGMEDSGLLRLDKRPILVDISRYPKWRERNRELILSINRDYVRGLKQAKADAKRPRLANKYPGISEMRLSQLFRASWRSVSRWGAAQAPIRIP